MDRFRLIIPFMILIICYSSDAQSSFSLDSIIRIDYRGTDSIQTRKTIYSYDEFNLTVEVLIQSWSENRNQWENLSRTTNSYQDNELDTVTHWEYNQQTWQPLTRTIIDIPDQSEKQIFTQVWIGEQKSWMNQTRTRSHLEPPYGITLTSTWDHFQNDWIPADSTISIYGAHRNVESDTTYAWIPFANVYVRTAYSQNIYDSSNLLIQRLRYQYDLDSMSFFPSSRDSFAYDENAFRILSEFDTWDQNQEKWSLSLSIERLPNSDGYLAQSNIFFFDFFLGMIIPTSRLNYTYTSGLTRSVADSLINTVRNYVYMGPFAVPDWKTQYYYSIQMSTSSFNIHNNPDIKIYPNPAQDYVKIVGEINNIGNYRWISANGIVISSGKLTGNEISVPNRYQSSALLFLQLYDNDLNLIYSRKILRQ